MLGKGVKSVVVVDMSKGGSLLSVPAVVILMVVVVVYSLEYGVPATTSMSNSSSSGGYTCTTLHTCSYTIFTVISPQKPSYCSSSCSSAT